MATSDSLETRVMRSLLKRMKRDSVPSREAVFSNDHCPPDDANAASFAMDYLLMSLLSKHKGGTDEKSAREAALVAWYGAEKLCYSTSVRLDSPAPIMLPVLYRIQQKILDVIGSTPNVEELSTLHKWGPGATYDINRRDASVAVKHTSTISVTRRCLPHLLEAVDPLWAEAMGEGGFKVVRGNRCVTVPKSAKTHRMISVEPTGNVFLQSAVGQFIRKRLMRVGINLDDQTVNQALAGRAYSDGLATIDLSSASDTMSRALVDLLLPPKWTRYLEDLRSPFSLLNGRWVRLEKFSSMGNGFTFELETLIFWAICSVASGRDDIKVYGDDIICRQEDTRAVFAALAYFGFVPNREKSFSRGPFYESCGKHFLSNLDVTPVYQKEVCTSVPELIRFHNRLFRWGKRTGLFVYVIDSLMIIKREACRILNGKPLPIVPGNLLGDFGFLDDKLSLCEGRRYLVCVERVKLRRANAREELGFLAWKIRSPTLHSNAFPDGSAGLVKESRYVYCRRTFWHSSCEAADVYAPILV